jgi:D-alanyl-lipoteichoic acid acyltransferase DltB (MBOAT superfamily)
MLFMQVTTMLLIGLWHGVSGHFVAWGMWHGLGMFIHNRFSPFLQNFQNKFQNKPVLTRLWNGVNWFITFNFVSLGWIWFMMPDIKSAIGVFSILFGGK